MPTDLSPEQYILLNRSATVARLLSGVAHEVNNALQVIGGSVDLLDDLPLEDPARTRVTRIRTQNDRAASSVQGLLAFARARPDAGVRVGLREVLTRAVAMRAYAVGRAGLTIALVASDRSPLAVRGSTAELQQAVLNLIANAEEALAGTAGGAIQVAATEEAGTVTVRVVDNGPGVPMALREQIFEPFFTTRPGGDAAGLGLAAARQIAARAGGTLTLETPATGACFALRLPSAQ
jgi:C4-dicarboxylate-specific signal transduction histidine kinase